MTIKCISCEETLEKDDYACVTIGEDAGEPLCWDCESDDLAEAVVSAKKTSDGETYCCGNYTSYAEDSDIESYFDTVKWTSTDAWRGYYSGSCPPGYKKVANTWFCGTDGFSPSDEFDALHSLFESDKLDDLDVIYAFPRTSNVFSTGLEVYVRNNHVELFKSLLAEGK